jgi:hypothetical protein
MATMLFPAGARAAETGLRSFTATGESLFVVPAGVASLHMTLVGGAGDPSLGGGPPGGAGAQVSANLAVTPGESLFIEVGGYFEVTTPGPGIEATNGGGPGGGDYGGGGGGASDVRTCSSDPSNPLDPLACSGQNPLHTRLLVAGGGGGGGGNSNEPDILGGAGGNAGEAGHDGDDNAEFEHARGEGGGQASSSAGGAGGGGSDVQRIGAGSGLLGSGGNGGGIEAGNYAAAGGGGGGGGIYGGGGGGGGESDSSGSEFAGGGGGGGGSSGVPAGVSGVSALQISLASHSTIPEVTFTWTQPAPTVTTGAVSAISSTSATLNGSVDPNGFQTTECHFQLSPAPPSGGSVPCVQQVGSVSTPVAVSAALTGLSPATAYSATLIAANTQGSSSGSPVGFTTAAASNVNTSASTATASTTTNTGVSAGTSASAGTALSVTDLKLTPARFRRGKRAATIAGHKTKAIPSATTISFLLSQAAAVSLRFERAGTGVRVGHACKAISVRPRPGKRCTRYATLSHGVSLAAGEGADRIAFDGLLDGASRLAPGGYRLTLRATNADGSTTASQHPPFTVLA